MKKITFYLVKREDNRNPPKLVGFSINRGGPEGSAVDSTSIRRGLGEHDDFLVTKTCSDANRWGIPLRIVHSEKKAIQIAHDIAVEIGNAYIINAKAEGTPAELVDLTDLKI